MRKLLALGAVIALIVLAGCAGIGGSPELVYEGQQYDETDYDEATVGYDGTIANNGDAPAENVSIVFEAELQNGDTYQSTTYLGTIEDGDSKEWDVSFTVDEEDMNKDWDNAKWTLTIDGDNFEAHEDRLD